MTEGQLGYWIQPGSDLLEDMTDEHLCSMSVTATMGLAITH